MATTGKRTVHWKCDEKPDSPMPNGGGYVIHWGRGVWRPEGGLTAMQTGDRVFVGDRLDGKLNVKRDDFTLMEIWEKDS